MPTRLKHISNNEIIVPVLVSAPRRPTGPIEYRGLVDTGAQGTVVSSSVIADLEPVATGKTILILADETLRESTTYLLEIGVIVSVDASDEDGRAGVEYASGKMLHQVTTVPYSSNRYDLILGMDLLSIYHITMVDGQFVISI